MPRAHEMSKKFSFGDAIRLERRNGGGKQLETVTRRHSQPSRDSRHARRCQHCEVIPYCLHGIRVVLMQALHAGRSRAEGIEEWHLDQVVALASRRSEGPCLGQMEAHVRPAEDTA